FLAPALYVVHALLTGASLFIASLFQWTSGFGFSAGVVDYFLSFTNPVANQPYMLIGHGLVSGVIYYFLFRFLIVKFNLKTPGREGEGETDQEDEDDASVEGVKTAVMAAEIDEGLGGDENVTADDHSTTRLRVEVKDMDKVNQGKIKSTGVPGINVVGKHNIQVIVGTSVQFVADAIEKIRK